MPIYLESPHPYYSYTNQTWTYTHPGAPSKIWVHFNDQTYLGYNDKIYLTDSTGAQIGSSVFYVYGELNDAWIEVPGDTINVRLVSDYQYSAYGFAIDQVGTVAPLVINTDSYLYACTGNNVSLEIVASGGTLPYTWALGEGNVLPDGVSLSYSGNSAFLTGNIPDPLLYYVWLDVIDANNLTVGNNFRLIIEDTPNITTIALPDAQLEANYASSILVSNKSPQALFELVEGNTLPSGLSLNFQTGEIYGRPDAPGEYTFTIRVKNYYFPII